MTRDEAIDVLDRNYPDKCFGILCDAVDMAIEALEGQKTGKWIQEKEGHFYHRYHCDNCGYYLIGKPTKYCPECGAHIVGIELDMEVEHD